MNRIRIVGCRDPGGRETQQISQASSPPEAGPIQCSGLTFPVSRSIEGKYDPVGKKRRVQTYLAPVQRGFKISSKLSIPYGFAASANAAIARLVTVRTLV